MSLVIVVLISLLAEFSVFIRNVQQSNLSLSSQRASGHHCLLQPCTPAGEAAGQRTPFARAASQRNASP